jgi:prophage regulatory protein
MSGIVNQQQSVIRERATAGPGAQRAGAVIAPPGRTGGVEVLREPVVARLVGLSQSTLRRLVRAGEFPGPRRLSRRAVGWLLADVEEWLLRCPVVRPEVSGSHPNESR